MHTPAPFPLRLEAVTHGDRLTVTEALRSAIDDAGGWVVRFQRFSNRALTLMFEVDAEDIPSLCDAITAVHELRVDAESQARMALAKQYAAELQGDQELTGSMFVTFVHDEPELKIDVPKVPG